MPSEIIAGPFWNPDAETIDHDEIRDLQWMKLRAVLSHVYEGSPFYRERLNRAGCRPHEVSSLEDFSARCPLLSRQELNAAQAASPPYGTLPAINPRFAVFHHQTSGSTLAPPMRTFDTARDWAFIVDRFATGLYALGARPGDRAAIAFGYGVFMGFWAGHYALQRIGCQVLPTGGMDSEKRVDLLIAHGVDIVLTTPTYALRLAQVASDMGIDLANDARIKLVVTSGEPRPTPTRQRIADRFGAYVGEVAGMTEAGFIMFECAEDPPGMHIIETDFIEEVLHPETREPVDYGQQGVRVMTTLGREGIVMLRYWTNDLVIKRPYSDCRCGRTWDIYQGGIRGRADDLRKIRGVWFSPLMVEELVRSDFPEVDEFQTVHDTVDDVDAIIIHLEPKSELPQDRYEELRERFLRQARSTLNFTPRVEIAAPGSLPRFEMKAIRFKDVRPEA